MTLEEARRRLNLKVDLIPEGESNRPGTPLRASHVTIHNTDNPDAGADAKAHAKYMKGPDGRAAEVSWHYTVDDDSVYQSLPTDEVGWHAKNGNTRSIGIEICMNEGLDEVTANDRAALLTAISMKELGLTSVERVVQHHHWTGKNCPHRLRTVAGAWNAFKEQVRDYFDQITTISPALSLPSREVVRKPWAPAPGRELSRAFAGVDIFGEHGDDVSPPALAREILNNPSIALATAHSSGVVDQANARQNIVDTVMGNQAKRSSYGTAPGGTVPLHARLLGGMLALAESFSFHVSELAGGAHSSNSRHYAGVAADSNIINGRQVSSSHPDVRAFKQKCRALGATEVLGPGDPNHDAHVHAAWPRPQIG